MFALSDLALSTPVVADGKFSLTATVMVTNTGSIAGPEVVRDLAPGASERVALTLGKIAVSYWDDLLERWVVERGECWAEHRRVAVARELYGEQDRVGCRDVAFVCTMLWSGL
ncbi:hypothetical protein OG21DRAFT_1570729 [Imleria badia]|nr:hypothetical protein OG21DRAFT_1570729 [Imleria badia]